MIYKYDHTPMTPSVTQGIYRRWLALNGLLYSQNSLIRKLARCQTHKLPFQKLLSD
jgi:hypothetical protein